MSADHQCQQVYCEECRRAVTRAYRELQNSGCSERSAFRAAVTVLALRHPSWPMNEHIAAVSNWLSDDFDA